MIEEIISRICSEFKYRKFKKALNEYSIILNKYGVFSDEENAYAMQMIKKYDNAMMFIRSARKLQMIYEDRIKEEKK